MKKLKKHEKKNCKNENLIVILKIENIERNIFFNEKEALLEVGRHKAKLVLKLP